MTLWWNECYVCWNFKYFTGLPYQLQSPVLMTPLSKVFPSEEISPANKKVKEVLEAEDNCHVPRGNTSGSSHSRAPYKHFTTDEKAKIAFKKASEIGVATTVKMKSWRRNGCS